MAVTYSIKLVPDMYGNRACTDCKGYGYHRNYAGDGKSGYISCIPCKGCGHFQEVTEVVPLSEVEQLSTPPLTRGLFGKFVHTGCGGGILFSERFGQKHWRCASCKNWGIVPEDDWLEVYTTFKPLATLSQARGAEKLAELLDALRTA